ncbi:MAG: hypothetical protein LC115_03680 [Bacteroidia bacterium]|nr:hypothetical protein [Bacteroidia bacterium]
MQLNIYLDYQNIHPDYFDALKPKLHKIYLLIGSGQKLPDKVGLQLIQHSKISKIINVQGSSKNNLDFHLSFLLGKHHQKVSKKITFVIVSKDKGFDYLVHYLNTCGRKTIRVEELSEKAIKSSLKNQQQSKIKPEIELTEQAERFLITILKLKPEHRPRKYNRILNSITSICAGFNDSVELIYRYLLETGKLQHKEDKIIYQDELGN